MDYIEIIERNSPAVYEVEEVQYVLEKYIENKTGQTVKINIFKNFQDLTKLNPFGEFVLQQEHSQLFNSFHKIQQEYYAIKSQN